MQKKARSPFPRRFANARLAVYTWSTPSLHLLCTCFAPGLHLVCTWFAPGLHLVYTSHLLQAGDEVHPHAPRARPPRRGRGGCGGPGRLGVAAGRGAGARVEELRPPAV
jgi:hypothetical protein